MYHQYKAEVVKQTNNGCLQFFKMTRVSLTHITNGPLTPKFTLVANELFVLVIYAAGQYHPDVCGHYFIQMVHIFLSTYLFE